MDDDIDISDEPIRNPKVLSTEQELHKINKVVWGLLVAGIVLPWLFYVLGFGLLAFSAGMGMLCAYISAGTIFATEKPLFWFVFGLIGNIAVVVLSFIEMTNDFS